MIAYNKIKYTSFKFLVFLYFVLMMGQGSSLVARFDPRINPIGVLLSPARIVKKVFTVEQILKHEVALYPENERMTREELEENDRKHFSDKGIYGTDQGIDEQAIDRIKRMKKMLHYIEPDTQS